MWSMNTMEYYSAIKKRQNITICDNLDESWEFYAKLNKSNGKGQKPVWFNSYME